MDEHRMVFTSTKEETGINLSNTLPKEMKTYETSKDNVDTGTQNYQITSNRLQEELGENSLPNLLVPFSKVSFCKLPENELAGLEDKTSRPMNNEEPSTPNHFKPNQLNEILKNASSSIVCGSTSKLNYWSLINKNSNSALQTKNIENNFLNSTMFLQIQQDILPNNLELASKCNKFKHYLGLIQGSKHFREEANVQKTFCEGHNNFKLQQLFNTKCNLSCIETSCSMNAFSQLGETPLQQLRENSKAFIKHKLLLSNTIYTMMATSAYTRKQNSLSSLSRDIKGNKTVSSGLKNKIIKLLLGSDNRQLHCSDVANNISKNYAAVSRNVSDQTLKNKLTVELKTPSLTLSKLITNSFLQNVDLENFIADVSSDGTVQGCDLSLQNNTLVQFLSLTGTVENTLYVKLLSNSNLMFNVGLQPIFKEVDKLDNKSLVQSKVKESILCNPLKGRTDIDFNRKLASEQQLLGTKSNIHTYVNPDKQHKVQIYPTNDNINQLLEGGSDLTNKKVSKKPLMNTFVELSPGELNINELPGKSAFACLNKKPIDISAKVDLSDGFNFNNLFETECNISSSSYEFQNINTPSNKIGLDKTIQFDGESLHDADFDAEIDKAVDKSINKYESFMCDKGVLATPDICDKSSQTDTVSTSNERQRSCKRCLTFDGADLIPSKRTKTYCKNRKGSNILNCEQDSTSSSELMSYGVICDSSSNLTHINMNGANIYNNLNDHLLQITSKDTNLTINRDVKDNVHMDSLYGQDVYANDEFSLYDEDMGVDDELNWSKDSKVVFESESTLSDHKVPAVEGKVESESTLSDYKVPVVEGKVESESTLSDHNVPAVEGKVESESTLSDYKVPVVEGKVESTVMMKSPPSFTNTPKKPILKVGLSRSARLKPLHQK